jgi:hypothetical protein
VSSSVSELNVSIEKYSQSSHVSLAVARKKTHSRTTTLAAEIFYEFRSLARFDTNHLFYARHSLCRRFFVTFYIPFFQRRPQPLPTLSLDLNSFCHSLCTHIDKFFFHDNLLRVAEKLDFIFTFFHALFYYFFYTFFERAL